MEYFEFFKKLSDNKVRYLICGGFAVNIYGIPRMTADIDLLLDFDKKNILDFEKIITSSNYKPILPFALNSLLNLSQRKKLKTEKNFIAFSYYNAVSNSMNIDVIIDLPFLFTELWEQRVVRKAGDTEINLVSVEQLIKMKKYSGRMQDKQDIIHLSKFKK